MDSNLNVLDHEVSIGEDSHPGRRLVEADEWPAIGDVLALTTREREVVMLLFLGVTRLSIAHRLGIGQRTVRQYMEQVYLKMHVQDRVELVLRIIEARDGIRDNAS